MACSDLIRWLDQQFFSIDLSEGLAAHENAWRDEVFGGGRILETRQTRAE